MSTEFVVFREGLVPETRDGEVSNLNDFIEGDDYTLIARRSFGGCYFNASIVSNMKPETLVYPTDNTPQGIFTVKDLLDDVEEQLKRRKK